MKRLSLANPFLRMLLMVCLAAMALSHTLAYGAAPVKIGILAVRPKPQALAQWQPLATVLKQAMPKQDFTVEVFTDDELGAAVASRQLDFVLTNPGHYVLLSRRQGLSAPLATLIEYENGQATSAFGGVIFSRAGQANINTLKDIKDKTVATVGAGYLAGYQMQAYELKQAGIDLPQDVRLLIPGKSMDKVVEAVLDGRADVGFVRSGLLEHMVQDGKLDMKRLKIINRQELSGFPVEVSTRLYPEWIFAALPHADENIAQHIVATLLLLEENKAVAHAMGIHGFSVPANYTPVSDMLREMRYPPFDVAPQFTLRDVWKRYFWQWMGALLALQLILILGLRLLLTRRQLRLQYQASLRSETRFRTLYEATGDAVMLLDEKGFFDCNKATLKIFGCATKEEFCSKHPADLSPPTQPCGSDSMALASQRITTAMETGSNFFEWVHRRADAGKDFPADVLLSRMELDGRVVLQATVRDITERKAAEHKLLQAKQAAQEAEFRYRTVADFTYDWEAWIDIRGRWLYCSPSCLRVTGYSADEFIANPQLLLDMVHSEDRDAVLSNLKEAFTETGHGRTSSFRIEHKEGRVVWIEQASQPVFDDVGLCIGYRTSSRDITERKQAESTLRKLSLAVEQSPDSIVITDLDANIEYVNQAFVRETGYSFDEAVGQNPRLLSSGKNWKAVYEEMWGCLKRGEAWKGELVNRRKDGSEYIESALISPVRETDGRITHYLAIKENITQRKNNEIKIQRLSRIYLLLSRVNEAIVRAHDEKELFTAACNAAVISELFRFAWIGMLDEQKVAVIPMAHAGVEEGYMDKLNIRLNDERTGNGPTGRAIRTGALVVCQDIESDPNMAPWREEAIKRGYRASGVFPVCKEGNVVGTINVYAPEAHFFSPDIISLMQEFAADISFALDVFAERRHREYAEEEVRQMNVELEHRVVERTRQLEAANKELEAFSYSVSHDLRAPLRSIDGFSRVLSKKYHAQLDATGQDWLERVCRASQHMGRLIDDMLDLSRVARGELRRELVDMSRLAENVADNLCKANSGRSVRFTSQQGLVAHADPGLLRIVMDNLLGNAWKYTGKKSEAEIEFGTREVDGERVFFVRDNGAGFNMDYADKLFGAFQRLHTANEFEGTGIGLATVQRIIHRHSGKVWAEAAEGQGATFYFTLPQRERGA